MTSFNQQSQNVDKQFNAGKDQFIQNIVLVGQFLDFAKVEGLIPKPTSPSDFRSIVNAFEQTFKERIDGDLAHATAITGDILKQSITKWTPQTPFTVLPLKEILEELPHELYVSLNQRHLWNAFFQIENVAGYQRELIHLYSLDTLWKKHFGTNRLFGISGEYSSEQHIYVVEQTPFHNYLNVLFKSSIRFERLNVNSTTYDEFRVLIAGIVIDLIRLSSIASNDVKFWKSIADLLENKTK